MAGKKYGLEDKYKMMYGGMTNPPVRASVGLFIRAGVAGAKYGAKKIAQSLAKSKDINVGSTLNKARDVSKYDTSTLTDKGAFVKRAKKLALPASEFVKRRQELGLGMKVLPDTFKKSTVKEAVKKTLKNPVVKYGAAAAAGYDAKEIIDDMKKPKGKRMGGLQDEKLKPGAMYKASKGVMAKKNLKKAALVGAGLLASNYLGKRAGIKDSVEAINSGEAFKPGGANISKFGISFKKGGMYKVKK
jgi:hypothetical protein